MCLTPDVDSCDKVVEGTPLVYKSMPNQNCNHPYMLYKYNPADKTLIHACSGLSLCEKDGTIIHSALCNGDDGKYERTPVRIYLGLPKMLALSIEFN